ncbi:putative recombination initiation defects 3 isoform X2 [Pyrus x bretschneideri]|uniref:putative recombination initiation defects 3 isoform X2 n=1 Tax=Pyrus x bretschneideri TaxID=225117 RepID=UPI00202E8BF7|nr:putative recombination initiation defects 3 isoform X2 [Pyrus x bretschneideri]
MKLKINKVCDLSSISVLPPHTRRPNAVPNGQASQLRSQPSDQSYSQGLSSQHNMFSQLSQNSQCDILTNDQRFGSQERANSAKKVAYLPLSSHARDESQVQISRSSTNLMRKWSSASVLDRECLNSEEFEHRIGVMETSLNKFGMILDSVQSDVMQVNKGMKDVSMEMEVMRQKLMAQDHLLQLMIKGQEDFKTSLDGGIKSISEEVSKITYQDKLQEISLALSALPEKIGVTEATLLKSQNKLHESFVKEMQKFPCSQNQSTSIQICEAPSIVPPKGAAYCAIAQGNPQPNKGSAVPPKVGVQAVVVPKIETGGWKSVKVKRSTVSDNGLRKAQKPSRFTSIQQERECRVIIESDEEIDEAFSCLFGEKETGVDMAKEVMEETDRILRRARRRKRKCSNTIIII